MGASSKESDEDPQQSMFSLMCEAARFAPHVHPDEVQMVRHSCAGAGSPQHYLMRGRSPG